MSKKRRQETTIILITSGFDDESTIIVLKRLRGAAQATALVGLTAGLITGASGLSVRADCSLEELEIENGPRLLVVPGPTACTGRLLADPRMHTLWRAVAANDGRIAVLRSAEPAFVHGGLGEMLSEPSVRFQGKTDTVEFIGRQLAFLVAWER